MCQKVAVLDHSELALLRRKPLQGGQSKRRATPNSWPSGLVKIICRVDTAQRKRHISYPDIIHARVSRACAQPGPPGLPVHLTVLRHSATNPKLWKTRGRPSLLRQLM